MDFSTGSANKILREKLKLGKISLEVQHSREQSSQQKSLNKWDQDVEAFIWKILTGDEARVHPHNSGNKGCPKRWLCRGREGPGKAWACRPCENTQGQSVKAAAPLLSGSPKDSNNCSWWEELMEAWTENCQGNFTRDPSASKQCFFKEDSGSW